MAAFLMFGLGFATINAQEIPEGIMPNKRQVVGTGVTTSSSTPATTSTPTTTSDPPTTSDPQTTTDPPSTTSTPPTTDPTTSDPPTTSSPGTSDPPTTSDTTSEPPSSTPTSDTAVISDSSVSSQDTSAESSTELPTTIAVTTTNADGSTITSSIATSTLAPASKASSSGGAVKTMTGKASSLVVIGSSTINRATLSGKTTITSAMLAEETARSTFTSYWTSNGQVYSSVVTTDAVYTSTTGFATATLTPSLQNGGGSGSNLSTSSKKIVGGVVGGIGGAILIGGIALVAWRLWGKKKRQQLPQDEYLDSRDDSIRREKRESQGLAPPPDRYQNPNGAVNTASNF